jgi:hypothetical protein
MNTRMKQWQNDSGRWKPKYSDKNTSQRNFVHQTSCTSIEFRTPRWKAGERPLSDGTAMKPEFDLQIVWPVSTSEKTRCFHTAKTEWLWILKWVPGVPVIVRTTQNILLCDMRGPVFQHLACTATTAPWRCNYINNPSFVDPQHLLHHLLRTLSHWTIRHKSTGETCVTKTSSLFLHIIKSNMKRAMEWCKSCSFPKDFQASLRETSAGATNVVFAFRSDVLQIISTFRWNRVPTSSEYRRVILRCVVTRL